MTGSLARAAPMRFLIGVGLVWTIGRGVALAGWQPGATLSASPRSPMPATQSGPRAAPSFRISEPMRAWPALAVPPLLRRVALFYPGSPTERWHSASAPLRAQFDDNYAGAQLMLAAYRPGQMRTYRRSSGSAVAKAVTGSAKPASRFSGSAWAFFRGGGRASTLSPVGQIGGGQAGARILYTVDRADRLAISARVSRTIGGIRQTEAAAGLDWKPIASLPVHLMVERRFAIDHGGRNAWTLGAAGGVDDVRIAKGWRLDGYGEAGVVGAHRRDFYADGAARIARAIDLGGGRSLSLGGGVWGGAQPGAARLDAGPSAVLRAPVAGHVLAVALDWRERVVGDAKPGSGVALTVATDF